MITVVGASGFIGRHVVAELDRRGVPHRTLATTQAVEGRRLGDLVYCAGVTGDFRSRPLDTVAAHVGHLESILRVARVESIVYLSSTRVYRAADAGTEDAVLAIDPADPDRLYDLSKALGEALVRSSGVPALVLRLGNVYGVDLDSPNFLPSLIRAAVRDDRVTLRTSLDSTRDYVAVDEVVAAVLALLEQRADGVYNVTGQRPVSHRELTARLRECTGCAIAVVDGAPTVTAPAISIARVRAAIDYAPGSVLDALPGLVDAYRSALRTSGPRPSNPHPSPANPAIVLITGLPSSGKTTLGERLVADLRRLGTAAVHLDGDVLRQTAPVRLGFDRDSRRRQAERAGQRAVTLAREGRVAVLSLIAPYASDRAQMRRLAAASGIPFFEVHLDTPTEECRRRDAKGLYAAAALGRISGLTGYDAPYEPPSAPEVRLSGADAPTPAQAEEILRTLTARAAA